MLIISKGVFKEINKDTHTYTHTHIIHTLINEEKLMKSTKTLK